jgi:hypothetical protein
MSSPQKVKHVGFYQYRETVLDDPSCRMLSQLTEVFHSNPDCEKQYENLPRSAEYPSKGIQKDCIVPIGSRALIGTRENVFL